MYLAAFPLALAGEVISRKPARRVAWNHTAETRIVNDQAPEISWHPISELFIQVRILIWNFGVTDGVDLSLGEFAGRDRPAVTPL